MHLIKKLNKHYYIYFIITFVFLPLLYLPQLFDGQSFSYIYAKGDFAIIKLWYLEEGKPFLILPFYALYLLNNFTLIPIEILFDIFACLFLILVCIEVKKYSQIFFNLDEKHSNLAALFTSIFPIWHTLASINISMYLFCLFFVLYGYRNFISPRKSKKFVGVLSLLISFSLESNLCFLIGLGYVHLLSTNNKIKISLFHIIFLFLIAIIYYFAQQNFFKPFDFWSGYNEITLAGLINTFSSYKFLNSIINYSTYLLFFIWIPILFFLLLFLFKKKELQKIKKNLSTSSRSILKNKYTLLISLSAFAAFPYIAVNSHIPKITYLADYYQRHVFLLAPIFGFFFSIMFMDLKKINNLKKKINLNFFLITFIFLNLFLLNYGNFRKVEAFHFSKNLTNELKNYRSLPKGNVNLIGKNFPSDLRHYDINYIMYKAFDSANWWGSLGSLKNDGPTKNFKKKRDYSIRYIFDGYENNCNIKIYIKNDLDKKNRIKKLYILNYKKYYNIDKILEKC